MRWSVLALLVTATAISYLDRQALAVMAPVLRDELQLSNFGYARIVSAFLLAYAVMQPVTGWLIDRLGTRRGFAWIVAWWSAAAMLHGAARGVTSFSVCRLLLGAGQAGSWAASVRAVAEWFPPHLRGTANGVWGTGTSIGMIAAVPIVAWLTLTVGWRMAFVLVGASGFVWLGAWLLLYREPAGHPDVSAQDLDSVQSAAADPAAERASYRTLLGMRRVWALVLARVFADPIMWFYNSWVPEYLNRTAGFSLIEIARYAWIPFFAQGTGIVLGGLFSDRLCRSGWPPIRARAASMTVGIVLMTPGLVAAYPIHVAASITAISLATFGFGMWAPNMMSLCADAFPPHLVGSVTGLTGVGAGAGGMGFTLLTGWVLDRFGYAPVFVAAGLFPLIALTILWTMMDWRDS